MIECLTIDSSSWYNCYSVQQNQQDPMELWNNFLNLILPSVLILSSHPINVLVKWIAAIMNSLQQIIFNKNILHITIIQQLILTATRFYIIMEKMDKQQTKVGRVTTCMHSKNVQVCKWAYSTTIQIDSNKRP